MRGRKPKPTELRLIEGNREHRPLNYSAPKPRRAAPACPSNFNRTERLAWKYLVRELEKMGTLATSDRGNMAGYCYSWALWWKAKGILDSLQGQVDNPEVIATDKGNLIQNPWLGIANRAMGDVVKYGSFLGLDPTSRTRIKMEAPPAKSLREQLMG